jgi:type I restriction enzyme S subunit
MKAERLLAHYEKIADAPDAIARLRRFILDLAVRGKLVAQDPKDEPASELLKRIEKERVRLVEAGEIKKERLFLPVEDDTDFDLPATWRWTRLGAVTSYIQRGKSPKYAAHGALVVSQKCIQWRGLDLSVARMISPESLAGYEAIRFLRDGDLLWNSTGTGTIGRIVRLIDPPKKLVCDSHVTVVRCLKVDPEYIRIWLRSDYVYALIEDRAAGSTNQVELTAQMAINQPVPLPPLAEQRRIVAKVDELMGLCDRLEAARQAREATRDWLAVASLARLNAPDPKTFQADARFALNALPAFTARPDQIKALRQTILNLAVRGKLVSQNQNDEPASELLQRIVAAAGIKRKEIARKSRENQNRSNIPTKLPAGWVVAPLSDLVAILNGRAYSKNELLDAGTPVLRVGNLFTSEKWYYSNLNLHEDKYCDNGDLIFSWSASFGPFIWRGPKVIYHYHIWKLLLHSEADLDKAYLYHFLLQKTQEIKEAGHGISMVHMTKEKMEKVEVPLPPLAEQQRIVAKVKELMGLCDRLEASLTACAGTRRRLLDALLAEALMPAAARQLAAAE